MTARALVAAVLGAALAACAQPRPAENPAQPGAPADASASVDSSPRFIGVIGTKAQHAPPFLGVPETNFYCLRSFIDRRSGEILHQVYVSDSYSGPERRWHAARDGGGHPLRFVEISRHEIACSGGCSYLEEFAADIPESELRSSPPDLVIIFSADSGAEKRILVSGVQISAQLAAIDKTRNSASPDATLTQPAASVNITDRGTGTR
jgi:hypothetical protein